MSTSKSQAPPKGRELPMFILRPSSGHSQDVRHILAKSFRDLYTRNPVRLDTVNNLHVSKGSDDPYHEKYVESLEQVYTEWQQRMDEIAMLERHIMQAQAKAMAAEERELNKATMSCGNFKELGLPPVKSQFRSCIDTQLLHDYNLLAPSDYLLPDPLPVSAPKEPEKPAYARETTSFHRHCHRDEKKSKTSSGSVAGKNKESQVSLSDGDIKDSTVKQKEKKERKDNFPTKHGWKENLSAEQREADRKYLSMLQARTNFLRNPRHLPHPLPTSSVLKGCHKSLELIDLGQEQQKADASLIIFMPNPPVIEFNNYKVGEVYEITLELKNMSTLMRQCRALPPGNNAFSVGLGQFPGDSGLVAPGMSCTYGVRFTPYSLRNYDSFINIEIQATYPLVIPLKARRPAPILTMPNEIDIGSCLVGGILSVHLLVKNEGGHGRFCLMPRNKWPTASIRSVLPNIMKTTIKQPPFEIYPATFELGPGHSLALEVIFSPHYEKSYVQEMVLVCDNCQISHFKLKGDGEIARISLEHVEMGVAEPMPGEYVDVSAKYLVRFEDLNPYTYTDRVIKISNCTKTELRYQWMIYKPILTSCFSDGQPDKVLEEERVPDLQSSFSIYPSNGVLQHSQLAEFRLTFAPSAKGNFHSVAHMLLQNVPPQRPAMPFSLRTVASCDIEMQMNEDSCAIFDVGVMPIKDVTSLSLEMKGKCVPLNVVLHPYALIIQAPVLKGSSVKRMFTMANHSYSSITFRWESYTESYFIEIEPPCGELEPGMAMDFDISVTGVQPGRINHTVLCHVLNMDEPLHFPIQADIKGPELKIEESSLNFGLIRVGQCEIREMTVINTSETIVRCTVFDSPVDQESDESDAKSELKFSETSCELQPFGRKVFTITLIPTVARTIRRICYVQYEGDKTCSVGVYGEAQNPVVCFLECQKILQDVYLGVPTIFTVVLHNQTLLTTTFKWGKATGSECCDCKIEVLEPEGELLSWQQKTISISFTPMKAISFSDVTLPCQIAGQDDDIYINIDCDVQTLAVSIKTSTDGHQLIDSLQLKFGDSVGLGEIVKRYVHICNQTAICAPYSVVVESFAAPSLPHTEVMNTNKVASQKHIILSRTPQVSGPQRKSAAKMKQDFNKMVLSKNLGAAFVVQPSLGHLEAFGTQVIEISAHSDLWGQYVDNLICQVGDLEQVKIPMNLTVIGCPLSFQITGGLPGVEGTVRFGSHIAGANAITRKLKINNPTPSDIRVDWRIFKRDDRPEKLLDFITYYGKAFPQRDIFGTEIIQTGSIDYTESIKEEPISTLILPNVRITDVSQHTGFQLDSVSSYTSVSERIKIVFCCLQPHDGVRIKTPFSMKPSQMIVPARGSSIVNFTFTPLPTSDVSKEMDFSGYARGYLNLDDENENDDKVVRPVGYCAEQLSVNFTAQLKPPLLTVELEDDGMRFMAAMSDIMKENEIQREFLHICSFKLKNDNLTPLIFKMKVKEPFLLIDFDPFGTKEANGNHIDSLLCKIKPRHSLVSKVAFCVSSSLLSDNSSQTVNGESESIIKRCFKDVLSIEFQNGVIQTVPLYATLTFPQMEVSDDYLDFGTCLVGQSREFNLDIFNQTASHSYWWISIENKSITCDDDTFQVQPEKGMLEAQITYTNKSKVPLKVVFTARHSDVYDCTFLIQGLLGESPRRILAVGAGSYDGCHEAILDV